MPSTIGGSSETQGTVAILNSDVLFSFYEKFQFLGISGVILYLGPIW